MVKKKVFFFSRTSGLPAAAHFSPGNAAGVLQAHRPDPNPGAQQVSLCISPEIASTLHFSSCPTQIQVCVPLCALWAEQTAEQW